MTVQIDVAGLRSEVDDLLDPSRAANTARWERSAFDEEAHPCGQRIIIYGAGQLGHRMLSGLRANGLEPLAFADRNPAIWSQTLDGVRIFSPQDAARLFGSDSVFVIAVWNPVKSGGIAEIRAMLTELGCRRIVPFVWLSWKYPETFLPYYLWDLPSRVQNSAAAARSAFELFEEIPSQAEFVRQLRLRLTGDARCLGATLQEVQYFPGRLFGALPDEHFVDCGAYDGDTLASFALWTRGQFRGATALEPDSANFAALERTVERNPDLRGRVRAVNAAVGARRSKVRFAASGLGSASICDNGTTEVDCIPLDELLEGESPTYIKMDIEGAELDALDGAVAILNSRPLLAICAYHTQDHLWRVPLRIRALMPDAELLLRPHCADGFDLVCYAVPPGRKIISSEDR